MPPYRLSRAVRRTIAKPERGPLPQLYGALRRLLVMSAAAAAAALRFGDAVVDGPLPGVAPADGRMRLLSQTLSPAAAAEHAAATARWREAKGPALRLLSPLPEGAAAGKANVLASAASFLGLGLGKARARGARAAVARAAVREAPARPRERKPPSFGG